MRDGGSLSHSAFVAHDDVGCDDSASQAKPHDLPGLSVPPTCEQTCGSAPRHTSSDRAVSTKFPAALGHFGRFSPLDKHVATMPRDGHPGEEMLCFLTKVAAGVAVCL